MVALDQITNYLPLIVLIVGVILWFARLEFKAIATEKEVEKIQTRNEIKDKESDGFREQMMVTMQEVKTTLEYVKQSLLRLERK